MTDGAEVDTTFVVDDERAGGRLDVILAAQLEVPRSQAAARIDAGEVRVDGRPARRSQKLAAGAQVVVVAPAAPPAPVVPPLPPVRFRDPHLLIVAKPAGLVVHPGHGHASGTLVDALRGAGIALAPMAGDDRPGIVHRLDRDTSGLLVVASTDEAYAGMVETLRRREVDRRYLALVVGVPGARLGRIEAPIGRDPEDRTRFAAVADGKPSVTRYVTLASGEAGDRPVSLLSCRLETGRTHQIRVHLTAIGHPIVGDPTYGARPSVARVLRLERPFLHAARLAFDHPVTGERLDVTEPLPEELLAALEAAAIPAPVLGDLFTDD